MRLRVVSHGGGVQSTSLLVLAAQGDLGHVDAFLFANVGPKAENPATLTYLADHAIPYADAHGLTIVELANKVDLYDHVLADSNRSIVIPVRMDGGGFGNRKCTERWKIEKVAAWTKNHGATQADPAEVMVGFSLDEWQRMSNRREAPHEKKTYPLIDRGITRAECVAIITRAGLPVPPRSSCWFCPYTRPSTWAERRRDDPDTFARAAAFEAAVNVKRARIGKDAVTLAGVPLDDIHEAQVGLFDADDMTCGGGCWT